MFTVEAIVMTGTRNQVLIVFMLLILLARVYATAQCPGSEDGRYRHPTSCRHYFECVDMGTENTQVFTRECPRSNRFFNPFFQRCMWLPSGNCNQRGTATTSPPLTCTLPSEVDALWGTWSMWGVCSVMCGGGYHSRTRECNATPPSNGGSYCNGSHCDTKPCNTEFCPQTTVNGTWGAWTSWSVCSRTCGGGCRSRNRECSSPLPSNGGSYCSGSPSETQSCNRAICRVNGAWAAWASWSGCSRTCGGGCRSRTRRCNSPPPSTGGRYCSGSPADTESCNSVACPSPSVNGVWGAWTSWSGCSRTCGGGYQSRTRQCDSPTPDNGGRYCRGSPADIGSCNTAACSPPPVNGVWGAWTSWSGCSRTCGGGCRSRNRQCDSPTPENGGNYCSGSPADTGSCKTVACPSSPVNGVWGAWTSWSGCSRTCGGGCRSRTRQCDSPTPDNGGRYCRGSPADIGSCNTAACPPPPVNGVWGAWTSWSGCSRTCGGGCRSRNRQCDSPTPENGGNYCSGSPADTGSCKTVACPSSPVNGIWGAWTSRGGCSRTCGGGTTTRTRRCDSPPPSNGGSCCSGSSADSGCCNTRACPARPPAGVCEPGGPLPPPGAQCP